VVPWVSSPALSLCGLLSSVVITASRPAWLCEVHTVNLPGCMRLCCAGAAGRVLLCACSSCCVIATRGSQLWAACCQLWARHVADPMRDGSIQRLLMVNLNMRQCETAPHASYMAPRSAAHRVPVYVSPWVVLGCAMAEGNGALLRHVGFKSGSGERCRRAIGPPYLRVCGAKVCPGPAWQQPTEGSTTCQVAWRLQRRCCCPVGAGRGDDGGDSVHASGSSLLEAHTQHDHAWYHRCGAVINAPWLAACWLQLLLLVTGRCRQCYQITSL
jgi:hypothetical protein